jgi:hypothetical protein
MVKHASRLDQSVRNILLHCALPAISCAAETGMACSNAAPKEAPESNPEDAQDVGSGPAIDEPLQTETP